MTSIRSVLSTEEVASFRERGFLHVPEAFPRELALEMNGLIWDELEADHGIRREERTSWRAPRHGMRTAKHHPLNERLASVRFRGAIDDLLGKDSWSEPGSWGGFLVTFPEAQPRPWEVARDTWHWDGDPATSGLLVFSFYSEVSPGGGGTLILSGSHRLIGDYYGSLSAEERALPHRTHRKRFASWDPWLAELMGTHATPGLDRPQHFMERTSVVKGVPARVVELTGQPGDAVFCSPGILHAASPNRSSEPRVMRVKFLGPESFQH